MKIIQISSLVIGNPWKNWVLVKVETDEGLFGWGDATTPLSTAPVVGALKELTPICIGKDPRQPLPLWEEIFKVLYLPSDGTLLAAMAGIETACWDIIGRATGMPLCDLFGGRIRSQVRAYANGWYQGPREPGFLSEKAAEAVALGYTALKFDPFGVGYRHLENADRRKSVENVRAVRDAVGPDVDLMIEMHDRLTPREAITVAHMLAPYGISWLEAPVWATDIEALKAVARVSPIRITAGERFNTLRDFAGLLDGNLFDIIQPEYIELGGISHLRRVAAIAEAFQTSIAPHNARSPLSTAVNVHIDAATPNVFAQETFDHFHVPWVGEVFSGLPKFVRGGLEVPDAPGLGVEIDEKAAADHPYSEKNFMNLFREGWEYRAPRKDATR